MHLEEEEEEDVFICHITAQRNDGASRARSHGLCYITIELSLHNITLPSRFMLIMLYYLTFQTSAI